MLSKCVSPSISTVHFKRRLYWTSLHQKITQLRAELNASLPSSTLGASAPFVELTRLYSHVLRVSAKSGLLCEGKQLHSHLIKLGLNTLLSLQNRMLNVYVKCKSFSEAEKVFDEMRIRNVVTWNTIISKSSIYLSFSYFKKMLINDVGCDHITLNSLLCASIELNDVVFGRELHCLTVKLGFLFDCFVSSALIDFYGKYGLTKEARRVFDQVFCRDLVLWNVMISCYASNFFTEEAFQVYDLMKKEGVEGDAYTFCSLLNSCSSWGFYELGRQVHGTVIKICYHLDVPVETAVVDMYVKNGNIDDARKAFYLMTAKNVVSWNTMIVGFGQHGDLEKAMELLREMRLQDFCPDESTVASILSLCGIRSAHAEMGQIHAYVVKNGFESFLSVANALINACSKCGSIDSAFQCFVSVTEPDIVTWTSIIGAYAFHGLPAESIKFFQDMLASGARPDRITFIAILSACSHGGLVGEGLHYFNIMMKDYQIIPDSEHYTCLVDLLGRAGLVEEGFNVLKSNPLAHTPDTLAAFIWACSIHGQMWQVCIK